MNQVVHSEESPEYVSGTAVVPAQIDAPMSIEAAVERYNLVVKFVKTILQESVDYGKIPGVDKPFLLKPGAEKLAMFFAYQVETFCVDKVVEWDKPFFAFTYHTDVKRHGEIVASCEGSCNSMESKYRWRNIPEWKASDADRERAIRTEKRRTKDGRDFLVYVVENDDLCSIHNTIMKMAEKRSFVGAVQIACGASEFFASEMEEIAEATWREVPDPENGNGHSKSAEGAVIKKADLFGEQDKTQPHWIDAPDQRTRFWIEVGKLGLSNKNVHALMNIKSVREWKGTAAELIAELVKRIPASKPAEATP